MLLPCAVKLPARPLIDVKLFRYTAKRMSRFARYLITLSTIVSTPTAQQ